MTSNAKPEAEPAAKPSVLDDEEFQAAAKSVLREGETVSELIDRSARAEVEYRKVQADFIARGLASLAEAERTGIFYDADDVHAELKVMLEEKRAERSR
ncbi:hypothetical protein PDO_1348 [Rhizobium sp. PDO1-076]|uniref:hypothetical protein n=1 Tax=Rhizobium sp. PDO1-076 TaxID=1125979 RepID=UPI00024E3597|nr:hypothetical protein [Rhizobium sp. PDO1-076]EHS52762.1 hypothetical protein PDO_1348 [Rhizobium sp. PDO1-076]